MRPCHRRDVLRDRTHVSGRAKLLLSHGRGGTRFTHNEVTVKEVAGHDNSMARSTRSPRTAARQEPRPPVDRPGLTLLETLTALFLSAILLAALSGVTRVLVVQHRAVQEVEDRAWTRRVEQLLQRDLLHANHYEIRPDGLSLQSYVSRDGRGPLEQAAVTYRIVSGRTTSALVREEQTPGNSPLRSTLLAVDVTDLRVGTPDDRLRDFLTSRTDRRGWFDIPDVLRVVLIRQGANLDTADSQDEAAALEAVVDTTVYKPRFDFGLSVEQP